MSFSGDRVMLANIVTNIGAQAENPMLRPRAAETAAMGPLFGRSHIPL